MRWPWWDRRMPILQTLVINLRRQELETAKEILAEVFGARPSDVEEMIRLRLEERSWGEQGCRLQALKLLISRIFSRSVASSSCISLHELILLNLLSTRRGSPHFIA
jgi:hypothetical protein